MRATHHNCYQECCEIIRKDFNSKDSKRIKLKTYQIKKCSNELVGFMGDYYKLETELEQEGACVTIKRSYFIKTLPIGNELYRDECERKGFFVKESAIYRDILPQIQKYASKPLYPQAFLTRKDLVVLEDFSQPDKNLKQMQDGEMYTLKHYQLFLEHLAELHAASLAWEAKEGVAIGQQFKNSLFELQLTNTNEWYTAGAKAILYCAQNHPQYQYQKAQDFIKLELKNILNNIQDYTEPSATLRNVFCHRDSWDRNIFWELNSSGEPVACRIVDFQLTRYSPPAIDVLFFLYNNIESPLKRSKLLKDLLTHYHQSLKAALKRKNLPENLITEDEFQIDCQRALLPVLVLRAICEPLMKLPKGWAQTVRFAEQENFDRYMNVDRTEMIERVAKIDATYLEKVLFTVQEIMEYFDLKPK
ncbi:hypothetical protein DOY81_004219 [Sarcophaga bullata]|nr:hypothetical protein DOY81_004219 [Sarcophaga bullata]